MAEQAQSEPTMEEILSSIRKIIADDGQDTDKIKENSAEADVFDITEDDDLLSAETDLRSAEEMGGVFESVAEEEVSELSLDDDVFLDDSSEYADDGLELTEEEPISAVEEILSVSEDFVEEQTSVDELSVEEPVSDAFEDAVEFDTAEELEAVEPPFAPEPEIEETDEIDTLSELQDDPEIIEQEPVMANAAEATTTAPLSDAATVGAAAGSLGRLMAKVDFSEDAGGSKSIESLVRDMMRPMLKEWLDANLPEIVEKHVEAEVARIARMAR